MKCPIDQTEMEKGHMAQAGELVINWLSDKDKVLGIFPKTRRLLAYRCPKCRKVELQTEEEK